MDSLYINEIIRVTYTCNWSCKFCNVLKTNNFGEKDVSFKEVTAQILQIYKKYTLAQRKNIILSFSGGEPTICKHLKRYIVMAKKIGVGTVQIQTNGSLLFSKKYLLEELIEVGLDEVFLAQHGSDESINNQLGVRYKIQDFIDWIQYVKQGELHKKVSLTLNIVVTKINLKHIPEYLSFLSEHGFFDIAWYNTEECISFGLVQPNGYANINKDEVLLEFHQEHINIIHSIVEQCKEFGIEPDFHYTAPPICILPYKEYNLEYQRLKLIAQDQKDEKLNHANLQSFQWLWKEKKKVAECEGCSYNDYCLGFYKNWIHFVGEDHVRQRVKTFLDNKVET